jgi:glutamine amidotransferase
VIEATIFDYGAGNLHSLRKALSSAGARVSIESDPMAALDSDVLVLPGVGNFAVAAEKIRDAREEMRAAILNGHPTLGICLGMQLLLDQSEEGIGEGLGVIPGSVRRLDSKRVPQIGWNTIEHDDRTLTVSGLETAYYANSFVCRPTLDDATTAWSTHEDDRFPAVIRRARAIGVQFHPEKSSTAGLRFIAVTIEELVR